MGRRNSINKQSEIIMKHIILTILLIVGLFGIANAQVLTLNSPETLAVPTATKIELRTINIDITNKTVIVEYRFLASDGTQIPRPSDGAVSRIWRCSDSQGSTCFTDTFSFAIRSQDVGTQIGKGLRALIWNKMRPDVLTGSNNATLP